MILANVRRQLGRTEAQLVLRLVSRGDGHALREAEALLADRGLDPLLDDPRLLAALLDRRVGSVASLPLFCYVIVRHALLAAGERDRHVADYVAALVLQFGVRDRAHRVGEADDERYETLAALLGAVESSDPRRAFLVRAHLGNYALWLSGLFPDRVDHLRWRRGGPGLEYYEALGQRGFRLAADHRLAGEYGLEALFDELAGRFGVVRRALNQVSDTLLFPTHHTPERLMRQVQDEARFRLAS